MYILLAALLIVVILWFVLKPGWAPKPPDTAEWTGKASQASKQAGVKASQFSKEATSKAGQMYQGLRGRFKFRNDTRELAKQFKQWVSQAAPAKRVELYNSLPTSAEGFAIWLSGLSDKELEQFTQRVARFCASLNFDLAWLTDAKVDREPELKQAVEDSVVLYSLAAWRANNVQQNVTAFLAYQAWLTNPKRHKQFGQELHQVLIQRGLVTIPTELYLASERERLAQAATAIRQVANENPAAFHAVLRQLAGGNGDAASTIPAPATEQTEPVASPQTQAATA